MNTPVIPDEDRPTLSAEDIKNLLNIGLTTAQSLMRNKKMIGSIKVGRLRRATPRAVQEYLKRQATAAEPPGP